MEQAKDFGYSILFLLMILTASTIQAGEEQGTLKECQKIKDKIEHYTQQKRAGGSAGQMAYLHKKRNHYKDLKSEKNCRKYKNKLK